MDRKVDLTIVLLIWSVHLVSKCTKSVDWCNSSKRFMKYRVHEDTHADAQTD